MKKIIKYVGISLIALTLFSCFKNEWTPENEKEFKEGMKKTLLTQGKNMFSEKQAEEISNCAFDKIKSKNFKPNDVKKPGVQLSLKQIGKECAQESFSKTRTALNNNWDSTTEAQCKSILRITFLKKGVKPSATSFMADCAITKLKEQNIGPADLQDSKNKDAIQKIGFACGQEFLKKK